jgi:hypothetical protein
MCLGLPYVVWLAALQRQRVMTKHGVAAADEEAWATACYPCSLLQMHALLQQQQQQQPSLAQPHQAAQQQEQASVPLRAPRVQQMTGVAQGADITQQQQHYAGPALPRTQDSIQSMPSMAQPPIQPVPAHLHDVLVTHLFCCNVPAAGASEAPSQASSYAGPLTSAMTTSKAMRAVRDHATRSEGTAAGAAPGGSMRPRDSAASGDSSEASETGVVNSPLVDKQRRPSGEHAAVCACLGVYRAA